MKNRYVRLGLSGLAVLFSASFAPIQAATLCVWTNSPHPGPPYNAWTNAARTIQTAVDAAASNDIVLVTNGVFSTGSRAGSRVVITNSIALRSVNGPAQTFIVGTSDTRCVYMTAEAFLSGFTLTNGRRDNGGGVCVDGSAVISNCVLTGNSANAGSNLSGLGGGASGGTLYNCTLTGNSANGPYASGGGAHGSSLYNCTLTGKAL